PPWPGRRPAGDAAAPARRQVHRLLAVGLVPAGPGGAQQDLVAGAAGAVVDVPVVAAARLEGHVADRGAAADERGQIGPADEVLREGVVGLPEREGLVEGCVVQVPQSRPASAAEPGPPGTPRRPRRLRGAGSVMAGRWPAPSAARRP